MQLIKVSPLVAVLLLAGCAGPAYTGQGANPPTASETPEQRAREKAITEDAVNSPVFESRQYPERRSSYNNARRVRVYPSVGYGSRHGWGSGVGVGLGPVGFGL